MVSSVVPTKVELEGLGTAGSPPGRLLQEYKSSLDVTLPRSGEYRIRVSTWVGRFGAYRLRLAEVPAQIERRLTVGQEVTDSLTSKDPRDRTHDPYHVWLFNGVSGQRVVIEMVASAGPAHLTLEDPTGSELGAAGFGPVRAGPNESRLDFTLALSGEYRIRASTWFRRWGAYRLRLEETQPRHIALNEEIADRLTEADPVVVIDGRGKRHHVWLFTAAAGQAVVIEMNSTALDAFLVLEDSSGAELGRNDNFNDNCPEDFVRLINARIDRTLPYTGPYRIRASSESALGDYALRVTAVPPERPHHIALGQEVADSLTLADRPGGSNCAQHRWRFDATAGQFVTIEMRSPAVDAYLVLQDSSGSELRRNDNSGGGTDARLNVTLPGPGPYWIVAASRERWRFGEYGLRVTRGRVPTTLREGVRGTVGRGQTVSGTLTEKDPTTETRKAVREVVNPAAGVPMSGTRHQRSPYHAYLYAARAGGTLTIEVRASSLDPLVIVQEPDGAVLASDDDGGEGFNARLTYTFPYTGTFRIVVAAATPMATGAYQLSTR